MALESESKLPRGEVTRARLIETAHALFVRQGFHGTSLRDIAAQAGMAVGGIYNHFPSKEALFAAVLDAYHPYHAILPALEQTEGETVEDFVRDAARRTWQHLDQAGARLMPLAYMELVEFQGRHLRELGERMLPALQTFVERFRSRRGQLRPVPEPLLLRTLVALFLGYLLTDVILRSSPAFRQLQIDWLDGMVDIYLHGILAAPAASRRSR